MSTDQEGLTCEVRTAKGKGAARAARREGLIPGVLYGGDKGPVSIALRTNEVHKAYFSGALLNRLTKIVVDGEDQPVIARDIQVDPVKDMPIHIDLVRVDERTRIDVLVPVQFVNEADSPGLKRGGVLNIVRREVELKCPATRIPESLEADLTGLEINDSLHISKIELPDGVTPTITDRDFTVATIVAPSTEEIETPDVEEESTEEEASE